MSLATPHSEPPITPHEGQTLPLPLPAHAQLPWTRSTAASQSIDSVILDISTGQRFPDSNPRRLDQEPPSATVFHGVPATATEAGSSSGTIPMKEIEPQGPGSQDPETLMPRAMAEIEEHVEDDSPYPIVRACVSNTDDPDMPIMTLRMWAVGLTLNILGGCINLFLNLRYPSIYLTNAILVVVAFVIGKILERIMPIRLWIIPSWIPLIGDRSFCLNPGPFNIKEHGLICMMTGDLISTPYGLNLVLTARKYYNLSLGPSALVLPISFGWITRKLFVYPSSKLWPTNLALSAVLNAFHAGDAKKGNHDLTRLRFFTIVMILYAFYHFLPGFLFTALSYFSFVCWIRPNNVVVNQLFGAATGLGMSLLSFDWFQIALIGSPMIIPWTVSAHIFAGFVTFYWILLPILYYTDTWNTGHLPIMGLSAYDRFAQPYDLNRVLNPDKTLNVTAYEEYPVYIPIGFVMTYLVAFIFTTTLVVATALDYGKEVLGVAQSKSVENDDIHARLMKRYPEIPGAWSAGVLLVSLGLAITAIKIADLDTPVWALFLAMAISFVYSIPALYIYSYSGKAPTMNLTFELVAGSIWRGRPLALMTFKIISVQWLLLGVSFIENLKLGHYLKIPPRSTFTVQIVAAIVVSATQVGLQEWIFNTVQDLCEADQKGFLICPTTGVFYTASILW
ncbi:hypothetical protein FRB90_008679 [Tulasnella sp. 427]|nr:hypothetical protein FRB90_008679 [Tulasnella sp. 427]